MDDYKSRVSLLDSKLNSVSSSTQKELTSYEEKVVLYTTEIERLSLQLKNRLAENEHLKGRVGDLEKGLGRVSNLENENKELRGQISSCYRQDEELKMKILSLE